MENVLDFKALHLADGFILNNDNNIYVVGYNTIIYFQKQMCNIKPSLSLGQYPNDGTSFTWRMIEKYVCFTGVFRDCHVCVFLTQPQ